MAETPLTEEQAQRAFEMHLHGALCDDIGRALGCSAEAVDRAIAPMVRAHARDIAERQRLQALRRRPRRVRGEAAS